MRARFVLFAVLSVGLFRCESDPTEVADSGPPAGDGSVTHDAHFERDGSSDSSASTGDADSSTEPTKDATPDRSESDGDASSFDADADAGVAEGGEGGQDCQEGGTDQCTPSGGACRQSATALWVKESVFDVFRFFPGAPGLAYGRSGDGNLFRWNGSAWSALSPPPPMTVAYLSNPTPNELWIGNNLGSARWDGSTWTNLPALSGQTIVDLWAFGPGNAWIIARPTAGEPRKLIHWDGVAWTPSSSPIDSDAAFFAEKIWASSPKDIWVQGAHAALHWDGKAWASVKDLPVKSGQFLYSIWGFAEKDVWIGAGEGELFHWQGTSWETLAVASPSTLFTSLWGSCPSDVWAGYQDQLWHYDGTAWKRDLSAAAVDIGSVAGTSPDDVWLLNNSPTKKWWHRTLPSCGDAVLSVGEQCDPPHTNEQGLQCGLDCHYLTCGNGLLDPGEQCDPPKAASAPTPACDKTCQIPRCGNLQLESGEQCDPPNGGACDRECQITCGNSKLDPGEQCDPPDGSVCSSSCLFLHPVCGNGIIEGTEECDEPNPSFCNQCHLTYCEGAYSFCKMNACAGLTGTDSKNCRALEACAAINDAHCTWAKDLGGCYCTTGDLGSCPQGANGQCTKEIQAVAKSTNTVAIMNQIHDANSVLGKVGKEAVCHYDSPYGNMSCFAPYAYYCNQAETRYQCF